MQSGARNRGDYLDGYVPDIKGIAVANNVRQKYNDMTKKLSQRHVSNQ